MEKNELSIVNSASYVTCSTEQVSTVSNKQAITKTPTTTVGAYSETYRTRSRRIMQNFLLVWFDANLDEGSDDFQYSLTQLQTVVNTLECFSDADQCVDYLTSIEDEKVV